MITANLYGFLRNHNKLTILSSRNTSRVYTACTILRNCHVAMNGSETSNYFNLAMPLHFLEKYMQLPGYN
jgi:hypothetical protein